MGNRVKEARADYYKDVCRRVKKLMTLKGIGREELQKVKTKAFADRVAKMETTPLKESEFILLLHTLGVSIEGVRDISRSHEINQFDSLSVLLRAYLPEITGEIAKEVGLTKADIEKIKDDSSDVRVDKLLFLAKRLGLDFVQYLSSPELLRNALSDEQVLLLCKRASKFFKHKRMASGMKVNDFAWRGDISSTTARRIEEDCSSVGVHKLIIYCSIVGIDIMKCFNKISSSFDPNLRTIEFYSQLGAERTAREINGTYLAHELGLSDRQFQACEQYRRNISTFLLIKWLNLVNVNIESLWDYSRKF